MELKEDKLINPNTCVFVGVIFESNCSRAHAACLPWFARARVDAPNGSRFRVRRCRVQKGVLWTSEAESLTESEHSRGRRRGALPPNGVFIFCASTLGCLHLSSGSCLSGLPLIPLDAPLSPPSSSLCSLSVSFLLFPSTPLPMFRIGNQFHVSL